MNLKHDMGKSIFALVILAGGLASSPMWAHQNSTSSDHHQSESGVSPSAMMTEKMGSMDMSLMMEQMGGMDMSAMMEQMSSMDISMMMGNNKGMEMMRRMGVTNLTEAQQNSINQLHDSMRKLHWELMGSAMDEQASLRDTLSVERPDPKQVGQIYGRLFDLKRQMIESRISTHNSVLDLLTEEQAQQMREGMMMSGKHGHNKGGNVN